MNLAQLLTRQADLRPERPAILERSGAVSFWQLEGRVARAATMLGGAGLGIGDPVLVFLPMSIELYVAMLAIFRIGAVAVFLDPSAGREHIERCCSVRRPRALVATPKAHLLRLGSTALRRIPLKFVAGPWLPGARRWARLRDHPPTPTVVAREADDPALLTFTSGSTGVPKAAERSHGLLLAQHRALAPCLGLEPGSVDLTTLPVFVLANLASGVTSLVPDADLRKPGAIAPGPVLRQIAEHRPVSTVASPAFLDRLARECTRRKTALPSFRSVFTGGAPVFPHHLRRFQDMAPNARIVILYGSTEAEPISEIERGDLSDEDFRRIADGGGLPAGVPISSIDLRILPNRWGDPIGTLSEREFAERLCGAGEPGEIVVSGSHVLRGYLEGRGDEETKFRVGGVVWHRTGDAGYLDEGGRLWLLGRAGARVRDGRGELYPFAVEGAATSLEPGGRFALAAWDGRRVLVAEPLPGASWGRLREAVGWAGLDEIRVVRRIPMDKRHNAKVDYPALLGIVARKEGRVVG